MKTILTPDYIIANKGCYSKEETEGLSFIKKPEIHITELFNSNLPLKDAYWFLFAKCEFSLKEKLGLCAELAEVVLPIYEDKYPDDSRVRDCINAIKKFNAGKITRQELRTNAYAAYAAAADAADDAAAAAADAAYDAYAADAADDAADAATYAADAADDAAYAADDAADDAAFKQKLIDTTINFISNQS